MVLTLGIEPRRSGVWDHRVCLLRHISKLEQNAGFEPVLSAWKADVLPLTLILHAKIKQAALSLWLYVTPHNHLSVQQMKSFLKSCGCRGGNRTLVTRLMRPSRKPTSYSAIDTDLYSSAILCRKVKNFIGVKLVSNRKTIAINQHQIS